VNTTAQLWAIGYEDVGRADQVRDVISRLAWNTGGAESYLIIQDIFVVVRQLDGSFTFEREPFQGVANIAGFTIADFLAGVVLAVPLAVAAIGAFVGSVGTAIAAATQGISADFIREVEGLMKPGTSALFLLEHDGNMDVILHTLQGLGGTVLKTNVDLKQAKLIQSTLSADLKNTIEPY